MKKFLKAIDKMMLVLSFDVNGQFADRPRVRNLLIAIKFFNFFVLIAELCKMLGFVLQNEHKSIGELSTVITLVHTINAIVKYVVFLCIVQKIKTSMTKLEVFYDENFQGRNCKVLKVVPRLGVYLFLVDYGSIAIQLSWRFAQFAWAHYNGTESRLFLYPSTWPFDPFAYWPITFCYHVYFLHILMTTTFVLNQMVIYSTAYLVASFDHIADDVTDVIEGALKRSFLETRNKWKKLIDIHSELIGYYQRINSLFGISLLVLMLASSIVICILGYLTINVCISKMSLDYFKNKYFFLNFSMPMFLTFMDQLLA
jgi:hypothetical protein